MALVAAAAVALYLHLLAACRIQPYLINLVDGQEKWTCLSRIEDLISTFGPFFVRVVTDGVKD